MHEVEICPTYNISDWVKKNVLSKLSNYPESWHIEHPLIKFEITSNFQDIFKTDVSVDSVGVLSHMFKAIILTCSIRKHDAYILLKLHYSYSHSAGGSNGYSVDMFSLDNGKTFLLQGL